MKKIFITGGTGGIGRSIAREYLRRGHLVGVCGGTADNFNNSFKDDSVKPVFYQLDVRNTEQCKTVISEFSEGNLDLLIACAGINDGKPVSVDDPIDFDRARLIIDINIIGIINSFEAALLNKGENLHLVAISSASAFSGFPEAPFYTTSKAAIMTLCEALYLRLKPLGVLVSVMAPGYIDTPLARATQPNLEHLPFITTDKASDIIINAIDRRKVRVVFPLTTRVVMTGLGLLPRFLFRAIYINLNKLHFLQRAKGFSKK